MIIDSGLSRVGLETSETPRDISFCQFAIHQEEGFEVTNALEDDRFKENPLVLEDPNIRFYAGAPLETHDGYKIGTLCVIDREPKQLTEAQTRSLQALAKAVIDQLELRIKNLELENLIQFSEQKALVSKVGSWEVDLLKNTIFWDQFTKEIHEVSSDYEPELQTAINYYK